MAVIPLLLLASCSDDGSDDASRYPGESGVNSNRNDVDGCSEAGRLEFPRLKGGNSIVLVNRLNNKNWPVNYCVEWDKGKMSQRWSCYQMYLGYGGSAGRYDTSAGYPFDPKLAVEDYFNGQDLYVRSGFDHGHICPSADRQFAKDANMQTFYLTNMQPQYGRFNRNLWAEMEDRVRRWTTGTDTLYLAKGGTIDDETNIITRIKGQLIVPKYFYMAVLCKNKSGYKALAFWVENSNEDLSGANLRNYCISIDELERRTDIDFFCNLDDAIEDYVEANMFTQSWTW